MNVHYAVYYYKAVSPKVCRRSVLQAGLQGRDLVDGNYLRNTALKLGRQSVLCRRPLVVLTADHRKLHTKQQKKVLGFEIISFKLAFILVYPTFPAVLVN